MGRPARLPAAALAAWKQAKPGPPRRVRPRDAEELKFLSGYLGFLNYQDGQSSRQLLLVCDDVFAEGGRLDRVLGPLLK